MDSLYAQYVKEREGLDTYETSDGFVIYKIHNNWVFIQDIFVKRESRRGRIASQIADTVVNKALEMGAKSLISHVDIKANNWQDSKKFIEAYGCVPINFNKALGLLYFQKRIG